MDDPVPHEQLGGMLGAGVSAGFGGGARRRAEGPRCGARTRAGAACRRPPARGRTRCNLHGGKSPRGRSHPRFLHGRYSKFTLAGRERLEGIERRRREREGRRESRYISGRYEYWVERQGGVPNFAQAFRMLRRWREEFREAEAERERRKGRERGREGDGDLPWKCLLPR
jgi:hypothetical protein